MDLSFCFQQEELQEEKEEKTSDIDGAPLEDVDGIPLIDHSKNADLDGEELKDVNGVPSMFLWSVNVG